MDTEEALAILGLPPRTLDQIRVLSTPHAALRLSALKSRAKAAMREGSLALHPDHNRSPNSTSEFQRLMEAYETINQLELTTIRPPKNTKTNPGPHFVLETQLGQISFEVAPPRKP